MSKAFSVKRNLLNTAIPFLRQYVTVIGSAHLDIFGEFDSNAEQQIDKQGKIFYSIGGGAYNVAANLTQYNHWVYLCTGLVKNSYISSLLRDKIKENRITTRFVDFYHGIGESGFVAHRNTQTHSLSTAVSCMAVERISFDKDKLNKAISKSRLVIVDCNLSDSTLQQIVDIAAKETPPILVMATGISESKIKRVQLIDRDSVPAFEVIVARMEDAFEGFYKKETSVCKQQNVDLGHKEEACKNSGIHIKMTIAISEAREASSMHQDDTVANSSGKYYESTLAEEKRKNARDFFCKIASGKSLNGYSASTICAEAKTRYLIIADGIKGYWIFYREHSKVEFFSLSDLQNTPITTTSGFSEALLAAVADHVLECGHIDMQDAHALNRLRTRIEDYVRRIINVMGSTVASELTWTSETDSFVTILSNSIRRSIKENIVNAVLWSTGSLVLAVLSLAFKNHPKFIEFLEKMAHIGF